MSGRSERELPGAAPILVPGSSCWRLEHATRAAFLIDAENYYEALAAAFENARHRIVLIGWDFHSRVKLRRDEPDEGAVNELAQRLDWLARRRRDLQIFVLEWDFALFYLTEREALRSYRFALRTHRRVHFHFDADHPLGASHHQKIAVVDDALAFAGGLDITSNRWDTRAHAAKDPRRVDPDGRAYSAFHDVQMAVDGAAAAALAELAGERWRRATGQRLAPLRTHQDPWPADLEPHVRDVEVGIARTRAAMEDEPAVREVETLYRESIAAARRWIYIENQYLTAGSVAEQLAARLAEPDGPEVVIVVPERCSGWLEESTMGVLRDRFVRMLREADAHDRLRLFFPRVPGLADGEGVNVHAKLMVVDDRLARVGSSNLSNRSMGLDTECDLAIEARNAEHERAVALFRNDLLAEHLGTSAEQVEKALARDGSLVGAVESLRGGERTLEVVETSAGEWTSELAERVRVFDPERPLQLEELLPQLGGAASPGVAAPARGRALGLLGLALGALALWRFTPLSELVTPGALAELGTQLRAGPLGALLSVVLIGLATLAFVPITALIVACGLVFAPVTAFSVALAGSCLGAAAGYALGRGLWRDSVRRLAGARFHRVSRQLGRRGVLATAAVRLVPIAPFGLVNLVAGASHLRPRDFLLGTALAMAPGTAILVFASDRIVRAFSAPDLTSVLAALFAVAGGAGGLWLVRRIGRSRGSRAGA